MSRTNEIVRLKECSANFLTRRQGEKVRQHLVGTHRELVPTALLTIDFDGVDVMTPSFADECFGKLAQVIGLSHFKESVRMVNANDSIRVLVNAVLRGRGSGAF